jgi:hypothetical protein
VDVSLISYKDSDIFPNRLQNRDELTFLSFLEQRLRRLSRILKNYVRLVEALRQKFLKLQPYRFGITAAAFLTEQ